MQPATLEVAEAISPLFTVKPFSPAIGGSGGHGCRGGVHLVGFYSGPQCADVGRCALIGHGVGKFPKCNGWCGGIARRRAAWRRRTGEGGGATGGGGEIFLAGRVPVLMARVEAQNAGKNQTVICKDLRGSTDFKRLHFPNARARIELPFASTCGAKLVKNGETLKASNSFCAHDEHATYKDEMTENEDF